MPRLGPYLTGNYHLPLHKHLSWTPPLDSTLKQTQNQSLKGDAFRLFCSFAEACRVSLQDIILNIYRESLDLITQRTLGVWFRRWWQIAVLHFEFEFSTTFGLWLWMLKTLVQLPAEYFSSFAHWWCLFLPNQMLVEPCQTIMSKSKCVGWLC